MYYLLIRQSYQLLKKAHPLILSSSTAFFATFSISPTIILLVNLLSFYFKRETISKGLFHKLGTTFGKQATHQIETIVNNFRMLEGKSWITVAGFLFLLFVATTLLRIMQQSIHIIWHLEYKPGNSFRFRIFERLKAVGVLLFMGLLFLVSLLLDTYVLLARDYLQDLNHHILPFIIWIINVIFSIALLTVWFALLFKILPDAMVVWQVALRGGLLTATCAYFGRIALGRILVEGNITTVFGASASFALILLFIFYSSFILYFGAAYTYVYGQYKGLAILPDQYTQKI